ncbi:hypothetical protein CU097_009396 [Rhizopus azygosporus]|uniref:Uncharacterized protein n=1 Tax=Rhizopus azygosporus TaxID=86630 RepID=A0A367J5U8_RHIAZ|nr:hypothetical protein CU097_009396 [Rhizopus azygosporus]
MLHMLLQRQRQWILTYLCFDRKLEVVEALGNVHIHEYESVISGWWWKFEGINRTKSHGVGGDIRICECICVRVNKGIRDAVGRSTGALYR